MSDEARFESFEDFWPFYVREHASKTNRRLHFAGTSVALACVAGAVLARKPLLLLLAPVAGYGFAWAGHFFVEGNRPATFAHPLWSLRGDLVMWSKTIAGTMDDEVARVTASAADAAPDEAKPADAAPAPHAPHATGVNGVRTAS